MTDTDVIDLQLRVDVSPRMKPTMAFISQHPRLFAWIGVKRISWALCRLFVRVHLA